MYVSAIKGYVILGNQSVLHIVVIIIPRFTSDIIAKLYPSSLNIKGNMRSIEVNRGSKYKMYKITDGS